MELKKLIIIQQNQQEKQDEYERFLKRMIDLKARLQEALLRAHQDILRDGNTDKKAIIPDTALEDDSDLSEEEFIEAGTEEHTSSLVTDVSEPEVASDSKHATPSPQDEAETILHSEPDPIKKGKSMNYFFYNIHSLGY